MSSWGSRGWEEALAGEVCLDCGELGVLLGEQGLGGGTGREGVSGLCGARCPPGGAGSRRMHWLGRCLEYMIN